MVNLLSAGMIAHETKIPETTIRRYVSTFDDFFMSKQIGRAIKYSPASVKLVKKINSLYGEGYSTDNIRTMLSQEESYSPKLVEDTVADDGGSMVTTYNIPIGITEMLQEFEMIKQQVSATQAAIAEKDLQIQELRDSQTFLDAEQKKAVQELYDTIKHRDRNLTATMRKMLDESKKPWWKRILGLN